MMVHIKRIDRPIYHENLVTLHEPLKLYIFYDWNLQRFPNILQTEIFPRRVGVFHNQPWNMRSHRNQTFVQKNIEGFLRCEHESFVKALIISLI